MPSRLRLAALILSCAAPALLPFEARAASIAQQTCSRGDDVRIVEVMVPGEVGKTCDLRYTREAGKNISVPFNADNGTSFCGQRARDLVTSLVASGFSCSNTGAFDKIAAMRAAVDLDAMLEGGSKRPEATFQPAAAHASDFRQPAVTLASSDVLAVPPPPAYSIPSRADGEPVALTPTVGPAVAPTRARYAVGRVVGASPEDARPSTLAALQTEASDDRLTPPAAEADVVEASGRPTTEVVKSTVMAQAAAWNDGDLAGFMNGFWNDPGFVFIAGSTVTRGWQETYNRYRDSYGESGDLGRLQYSDLDAKMLAPESASVVGRYAFTRGPASSSGALTLVLRRFEGAWRVVQHQMVTDAPPPAPPVAAATETQPTATASPAH